MGRKPKYHQGLYKPRNPEKYKGNVNNVVFRSSLEKKFFHYCDTHPQIIEWASEETIVPYISKVDGKKHRYFVDLYIKVKDSNGNIRKYLVEIKPEQFTKPPKKPKKLTKYYVESVKTYIVNQCKWEAATKFAKKYDSKFIILTEKDIV